METQELMEMAENANRSLQRRIGMTMAIFAAVLATVTMLGHRLHTEEVVLQTRLADQWAYYQAKNTRSQMYAADAALAGLQAPQGAGVAAGLNDKARQERQQADEIRRENDNLARDTVATAHRATLFDGAEVFLEIAIVLCSISLLTGAPVFWKVSFAGTAVALALAGVALLR